MKKGMVGQGSCLKKAFCLVAGLTAFGLADNPISSYHYLADPSCTADDEYFYIITDSDDPAGDNGYTIKSLYAFRSRDMKNWSDFGIILEAKREYTYIGDIWASGIAKNPNDGRFYIVYPDGGGQGVGMVGADNFNGPYKDPIPGEKHKLVNAWGAGIADCDQIGNCFDPAIFFDDDANHTGYFTFGGGSNNARPHGYNFDLYTFNKDMKGFDTGSKVRLEILNKGQRIPNSFEASYLHKNNGIYYLSYSTDFSGSNVNGEVCNACIAYATSKDIKGPYTYRGIFLENPHMNGQNINANNNNHAGVAKFKGEWYAVYHERRLVQASEHPASCYNGNCKANPAPAYHRSVSVDKVTYSGELMNKVKFTNGGPDQIEDFNPYEPYPALTSSKQRNVRSRTDWNKSDWEKGIAATHVLTPLASRESWIRVSGVEFGKGAKTFRITGASVADGNKVEIHKGSVTGALAGTCDIQKTKGWNDYVDNECEMKDLSGLVDQLFIVFKGAKDSTMGLIEWEFIGEGGKTPDTPQSPFGGTAAVIPGKVEAENFDVPGVGRGSALKSYYDTDSEDHGAESNGGTSYREGTGVDIYKKATGYVVGYNADGEWLEYTVDVKEAGDYTVFASVATDNNTSGFTLSLDGTVIAEFGKFNGSSFDIFDTVQANVNISTTGKHILRMDVTSPWFDVDFFAFVKGENATSTEIKDVPTNTVTSDSIKAGDNSSVKPGTKPAALYRGIALETNSQTSYTVFDLRGNKVASFTVANGSMASIKANVANLVKQSGFYIIKPIRGGATMRIAITK